MTNIDSTYDNGSQNLVVDSGCRAKSKLETKRNNSGQNSISLHFFWELLKAKREHLIAPAVSGFFERYFFAERSRVKITILAMAWQKFITIMGEKPLAFACEIFRLSQRFGQLYFKWHKKTFKLHCEASWTLRRFPPQKQTFFGLRPQALRVQ